MPGIRGVSLASLAAFGAIVALLMASTSALALSVFTNPTSGPVGTQTLLSGAQWPVGYNLRVSWDDGVALGNTVIDTSGAFAVSVTIPANASIGDHQLRVSAWTGQFIPVCIVATSEVRFTVTAPGEPAATATTGTVSPTASASPSATTTPDPSCATATATSTATGTATATVTTTVTTTATATATVTGTRPATATATRTPTKTGLPATGSGGLLGTDDNDDGPGAAAYVALVLLGGGIALTGTYILRHRRAS